MHILAVAVLATAMATTASAQLYAGVHAGYALSTANGVLGTTTTQTTTVGATGATTVLTAANNYGTSGAGVPVGVNVGYMFSDHFGVDLGVDYFLGSDVTATKANYTVPYTVIGVPVGTQTTAINAATKSTQIRVTPSLVVMASKQGIAPYARFGVVLPVSGETVLTYTNSTQYTGTGVPSNSEEKYTSKIKGAMSVGFNSAIGLNIGIGEKLTVFGEVALTTLSIKAVSSNYDTYSRVQGSTTTGLADLKSYAKNTNYVDNVTEKSNNSAYNSTSTDQEKPKDVLATTGNYNSLGLNVGVRFKF